MKLFRILTLIGFVAAIVIAPAWAAKKTDPSASRTCLIDQLAQFALEEDFLRTTESKVSWLEYKNGANPDPQIVDLAAPCLIEACPMLSTIPSKVKNAKKGNSLGGKRSQYERAVLLLRKGDTVTFGDQQFVLGDFLGAGNTTHIYRIQGTRKAIRIPFLPDLNHPINYNAPLHERQADRRARILRPSAEYPGIMKDYSGGVKVLQSDSRGRFHVVEFVEERISGEDWITQTSGGTNSESGRLWIEDHYVGAKRKMTAEEIKLTKDLYDLMEQNRDVTFEQRDGKVTILVRPHLARQYLLDAKKKWRLVDHD